MKTIRFNLPIDGVKVRTVDELRDHFTTKIVDHFRTGVLEKWLRSRRLTTELAAVEALSKDDSDETALLALCDRFNVDADQQTVAAALAEATGVSAVRVAKRKVVLGTKQRGRCALGRQDQWQLDIPAPAVLELKAYTEQLVTLSLADQFGRQLLLWRVYGPEQWQPIPCAYLPAGRYDIQVRGECDYRLLVNESDSKSGFAQDDVTLVANGGLSKGCADLWEIFAPGCLVRTWTRGNTDTLGSLFSGNGRTLKENDDDGVDRNFRINSSDRCFGRHIVMVSGFSGSGGPYELHVKFHQAATIGGAWCALTKLGTSTNGRGFVMEDVLWRVRSLC